MHYPALEKAFIHETPGAYLARVLWVLAIFEHLLLSAMPGLAPAMEKFYYHSAPAILES